MRFIYLHGFASGPQSRKATLFRERLAEHEVELVGPNLDEGDFRGLTITRQLQLVRPLCEGVDTVLIGSSLGGYLAALIAAEDPRVRRMVLLAPGFDFYETWRRQLDPVRLERWQLLGETTVYHYAAGRELPLSYRFLEDASQYPPFPEFRQRALILHGTEDQVVPFEQSRRFVESRPWVRLVPVTSGHEMTDVLETVWHHAAPFLLEGGSPTEC